MNVLFWDIDQTLVMTGHAGFMAIARTLAEMAGEDTPLPKFDAGGRTDNYICRAILRQATGREPTMAEIQRFGRRYEEVLLSCMQQIDGYLLPHVRDNLAHFAALDGYDQLLLTGNSRTGANLKLSYYGLAKYFDFTHSAFAEEDFDRIEVAARARRLAEAKWGERLERVFIIGDTEHDIRCGQAVGAYTVAVATGTRTAAQLAAYRPWQVLPQLPPPQEMEALLGRAEATTGGWK